MKTAMLVTAWAAAVGTILYLGLNPQTGIIYDHPGVALAFLLVGLGLTMEARQRAVTTKT